MIGKHIFKKTLGVKSLMQKNFRFASNYNSIIQMDEVQESLKEMARNFCKEELEPIADKIDRDDKFDLSLWRNMWFSDSIFTSPKMGDQGFLGITAPEE